MGLLEPGHLILLVLAALLIFGPRKLPELGRSLGETLREFRKHTSSVSEELRRDFTSLEPPLPELPGPTAPAPPAVSLVVAAPAARVPSANETAPSPAPKA